MSKMKPKDAGEIFTIQFDQVNDSSEIPDIASLLGSKKSSHEKTTNHEVRSLKEFGTKLEVHFLLNHDSYQYIQHNDLSSSSFFGLDEILRNMKISAHFVKEFGTFGEFKKNENEYLFDAFGISDQIYLQFVINQNNKILTVYASENSMMHKKQFVINYAENQNADLVSNFSNIAA